MAQVFSFEFCGISKNTFFTEHLWATASNAHFVIGISPAKRNQKKNEGRRVRN